MRKAGTPNSGMARIKNPSVPPSKSIFCSKLILARIASARASASDSDEDRTGARMPANRISAATHTIWTLRFIIYFAWG